MIKKIIFLIVLAQSCESAFSQDWAFKFNNWNETTYTLKNYLTEWNNHILLGNYSNKESFNISVISKDAKLVNTISFKANGYKYIEMWGIKVFNGNPIIFGTMFNFTDSSVNEQAYFFKLDSCFNIFDFTVLKSENPKETCVNISDILEIDKDSIILEYYSKHKDLGSFNGIIKSANNIQTKGFFIGNDIIRIEKLNVSKQFYFTGNNYVKVKGQNPNINSLKGFWGNFDQYFTDIKYNHYKLNDSNSYSNGSFILPFSDNKSQFSIVGINDRAAKKNPDIYSSGNILRINNSTNGIEKEIQWFTDTNQSEIITSALLSNEKIVYVFTAKNNSPIFHPSYVYKFDIELNLIETKRISNLFTTYINASWDNDSNIFIYASYNNVTANSFVLKLNKNLEYVQINPLDTSIGFCRPTITNLNLSIPDTIWTNFDTNFVLKPTESTTIQNSFVQLKSINAFPNPFNNNIELKLPEGLKDVTIFNLNGEIIYFNHQFNLETLIIPTTEFPPGVYFIQVKKDNLNSFLKILKI